MAGQGMGGLLAGLGTRAEQTKHRVGIRTEQNAPRNEEKPFSGFLRTILDVAEAANGSSSGKAERSTSSRHGDDGSRTKGEKPARTWPESTSEQEREVLERVAVLVAEGSLPAAVLEDMTEDSFRELAAWVLEGAGGLFPAHADVDAAGLFASMGETLLAALQALGASAGAGLGAGAGADEGSAGWSRLAGVVGLDQLDADAKAVLIETLTNAAALRGAESPVDALKAMPVDEMTALLQKAMQAAGLEGDVLDTMPELAIRGLLVDLVDEGGGSGVSDARSILGDLMHGASLGRFARTKGETGDATNQPTEQKGAESGAIKIDLAAQKGGTPETIATEGMEGAETIEQTGTSSLAPAPETLDTVKTGTGLGVEAAALLAGEEEPLPLQPGTTVDVNRLAVAPDAPEAPLASRPVPVDPGVSTVDMLENIERIEQIMRVATRQNGIQHVSMQLSPPHLGRMSLSVEMRGGVLTATLRTESVEARNMVLAGVEQLRRNLEVQGVQLEGFDVSVDHGEGQNQEAWQDAREAQQAAHRRRGNQNGTTENRTESETVVPTSGTRAGIMGDGSVNIVA